MLYSVVREHALVEGNGLDELMGVLQSRLLDIGAHLATPLSSSSPAQIARMTFDDDEVRQLEHWIDQVNAPHYTTHSSLIPLPCPPCSPSFF